MGKNRYNKGKKLKKENGNKQKKIKANTLTKNTKNNGKLI